MADKLGYLEFVEDKTFSCWNMNLSKIRGKKVLIVDDILGSGATIRKIKEEVKKWEPEELRTAICVVNEQNWEKSNRSNYNAEIEYIGKAVRGWVVFPWEMQTMLLLSRSMYKYESTIRQALEDGKTVIEDRSIDTIALYQAILIAQKNGGNPLEIAEKIYSFAGSFRQLPQKTFLLYGNPDLAISRAEKRDGMPYKPDEIKLLKTVDKFYSIYADIHPERFIKLDISKEDSEQIVHRMQNIIEDKNLDERG